MWSSCALLVVNYCTLKITNYLCFQCVTVIELLSHGNSNYKYGNPHLCYCSGAKLSSFTSFLLFNICFGHLCCFHTRTSGTTLQFFCVFQLHVSTALVSVTLFPCVVPQQLHCHCWDTLIILIHYLLTNLSQADTVLVK